MTEIQQAKKMKGVPHNPDVLQKASWEKVFTQLKGKKGNKVLLSSLKECFLKNGIKPNTHTYRLFEQHAEQFSSKELTSSEFSSLLDNAGDSVRRALSGDLAIKKFPAFCEELESIYAITKANTEGEVASYIPQLARVNPEKYAVSICTVDGQSFSHGDDTDTFCLQSVSKPITYCMAVEEFGLDKVHQHIGCEPSGRGFNAFAFDYMGRPHNPMINSGAIMCASLIHPEMESADRFDKIMDTWRQVSGGAQVGFDNPTYLSEKSTADRNHALAYFMRENKAFPGKTDIHAVLDLYFQICSITLDANALSVAAATLANGGVCPVSGQRVFSPETVRSCLSLMYSCGMYDYSGEFAFKFGLPAKSGVSGCLMVIIPNVMGLCVWSPRLDRLGNTVRGIDFSKELVERFDFHLFDQLVPGLRAHGRKVKGKTNNEIENQALSLFDLCQACAEGDLAYVKRLVAKGINVSQGDYDGRTPLHLAASEGKLEVIRYLVENNADTKKLDRWGNTPIDDAIREKHEDAIAYFKGL